MRHEFGSEYDSQEESPVYSKAAEMGVLGSILLIGEPEDIRPILSEMTSGMFLRPAHRILFSSIEALVVRGHQIDIVTLGGILSERGKLADVGGENYLLEIAEFTPSAANWSAYADIVRDKAAKRALVAKWQKCLNSVETAELTELLRLDAEPSAAAGTVRNPISHASKVLLSQMERECVTTGFATMDAKIGGGWVRGQGSIVSATHKGGKTTLMLSSFARMLDRGLCCLYATLGDMSQERLKARHLRNLTGYSKRPLDDQFMAEDFDDELKRVDGLRAYYYDATCLKAGRDVSTFCRWIEAAHAQYRFDAVFVDYAQLMRCSSKRGMTKTEEQDECSSILSELWSTTKVAGIIGSQITTDGDKSVTKNSRKWEEDAGLVLRISGQERDVKMIEVAHNRHGLDKHSFAMARNDERLRFEERAA